MTFHATFDALRARNVIAVNCTAACAGKLRTKRFTAGVSFMARGVVMNIYTKTGKNPHLSYLQQTPTDDDFERANVSLPSAPFSPSVLAQTWMVP
jgi:hypothetical protein